MATSQMCCHLPGEILNSAAECADRARIHKVDKNGLSNLISEPIEFRKTIEEQLI
jgi:hypothetical protein